MRSEFDTLEQYQESMKEFNENTRMGFEEFIQSHGSGRNKLQLRCTPYTSKKGGYGSFDLDFGLCVYQHQQSKVDELKLQVAEMKSRLNDAYTDGQSAMYAARQTKVDDLQKQVTDLDNRATKYALDAMATAKLNAELQKRVDAALKMISINRGFAWGSVSISQLEQALKGGQ